MTETRGDRSETSGSPMHGGLRRVGFRLVIGLAAAATALALGAPAAAHPAPTGSAHRGQHRGVVLRVDGAVDSATSYTMARLRAEPQHSFTAGRSVPGSWRGGHHQVSGVLLQDLVTAAAPRTGAVKNPQLRVSAGITERRSAWRGVGVAMGETDPSFGNHPAVLVLSLDGRRLSRPALVLPGDKNPRRFLRAPSRIHVAVAQPPGTAVTPPPGGLQVRAGRLVRSLSGDQLRRLPARTRHVSYGSASGQQTHTEYGPALETVLWRAGLPALGRCNVVTGIGDDGYRASVTPGEARSGGRGLQVSLAEDGTRLASPRLVVDGDLKGGRYVSGLVALQLSNPCLPAF